MRRLAALALGAALLSCSNGRSSGSEVAMSPTKRGERVRRTTVTIPPDQSGLDLDGIRGFEASQHCAMDGSGGRLVCLLPPADGVTHRVAVADLGTSPPTVAVRVGLLADGGATVVTGDDGARLTGSAVLPVEANASLGPAGYVKTSWYAPLAATAPLLRLARIPDAGRWSLEAYDPARASMNWKTGTEALPGEPIGLVLAADGLTAYVALKVPGERPAFELVAIDAAVGTPRWRARLDSRPTGTLLVTANGAELVVLVRDTARCQSCLKLTVVSTSDGHQLRELPLAQGSVAETATSAGLSGETAWFYRYSPTHMTSDLAPAGRTPVSSACDYEVYDLSVAGKPIRTMAAADGEWKAATLDCKVHALLPLADGHVAAIHIVSKNELVVVEFDGAP